MVGIAVACIVGVYMETENPSHVTAYSEHEAACWEAVCEEGCVLLEVSYYWRCVKSLQLLHVRGWIHWLLQTLDHS